MKRNSKAKALHCKHSFWIYVDNILRTLLLTQLVQHLSLITNKTVQAYMHPLLTEFQTDVGFTKCAVEMREAHLKYQVTTFDKDLRK